MEITEKLELIASIIYIDNIEYGLYNDGKIYFYDKDNKLKVLEDKTMIEEIRKYFQSPETDVKI